MKTLNKLIVVSATLASLLSTNAMAEGMMKRDFDKPKCQMNNCHKKGMSSKRFHHSDMKRNPIISTIAYLDLTSEQQKAFKELKASHQKEIRQLRRDKRQDGSPMHTLINALNKDGVDKDALLNEATKKFQEREAKKLEHLSQVLAILTPQQRLELKKLLQNKMNNRMDNKMDKRAKRTSLHD